MAIERRPVRRTRLRVWVRVRLPPGLVWLFRLGAMKSLIQGLAASKPRLDRMPMRDARLAHLPAEEDDFFIDPAWKVEQPGVQVLHLHPDRVNLADHVSCPLHQRLDLRALA